MCNRGPFTPSPSCVNMGSGRAQPGLGATVTMRDRVTFTARRVNGRPVAVCRAVDRDANEVEFVLDAATMAANFTRQVCWAYEVAAIANVYNSMLDDGVSADAAWTVCNRLMPAPLSMGAVQHWANQHSG